MSNKSILLWLAVGLEETGIFDEETEKALKKRLAAKG
jgi:hypothetical protein